jgi:hypothetical protein
MGELSGTDNTTKIYNAQLIECRPCILIARHRIAASAETSTMSYHQALLNFVSPLRIATVARSTSIPVREPIN